MDSLLQNTTSLSMFIQNFKILCEVAFEKSLMNYFIGEKEKRTNKENDKYEDADSFLHNRLYVVVLNVRTKVRNPRCSSF